MSEKWIVIREGELGLEGDLVFETISPLCQAISAELSLLNKVTISLAQVQRCDSASLVLLLSIIEYCNENELSVTFTDMPNAMHTLINLYNLQSLFSRAHDI